MLGIHHLPSLAAKFCAGGAASVAYRLCFCGMLGVSFIFFDTSWNFILPNAVKNLQVQYNAGSFLNS